MKLKSLFVLFIFATFSVNAATYYVDPSSAVATSNGALATPWKRLSQVDSNMSLLLPGDFVLFKRGQVFNGRLTITRSGTAGNPITFGAYGTGADPHFWGTGATISSLFYMINRSYITFYGLRIADTTISVSDRSVQSKIQRAFYIDGTSNNVIIRKCSLDRVGIGAYFVGPTNWIDSCDIGNMRMVRNTPTSINADDDYGANPVVISSQSNKITKSYFHDCWATSYDYQYDGGAIEFFGNGASNNFIAYNTFIDCNGVVEHGSSANGTIANNIFAYNKMINNGSLFYINNGGNFVVTVTNLQFHNNVIVETVVNRLNLTSMGGMRVSSTEANIVNFKNNIFWYTSGIDVVRSGQFTGSQLTRAENIYYLTNGSVLNFTASASDYLVNPLFVSTTGDPLNWNYQLQSGSPAIDKGTTIGYTADYANNSVSAPVEIGIYEYNSTPTTPPVPPTPTPTSVFLILKNCP